MPVLFGSHDAPFPGLFHQVGRTIALEDGVVQVIKGNVFKRVLQEHNTSYLGRENSMDMAALRKDTILIPAIKGDVFFQPINYKLVGGGGKEIITSHSFE